MLWLLTGEVSSQHVAPIRGGGLAFNTANMDNQRGIGVTPLTNAAYGT